MTLSRLGGGLLFARVGWVIAQVERCLWVDLERLARVWSGSQVVVASLRCALVEGTPMSDQTTDLNPEEQTKPSGGSGTTLLLVFCGLAGVFCGLAGALLARILYGTFIG